VAEPAPKTTRAKQATRYHLATWLRDAEFAVYTVVVLCLLLLTFLWQRMFISVPPGHSAVMYRYFLGGTVTDRIWNEGLNVIAPWDQLVIYETRMHQEKLSFDVLSEEGLDLGVVVSIRYHPNKDMLGYLHQDIGDQYFERLIRPEVELHVRRTFGNRPAHEIYSSARDLLQELGKVDALGRLEDDGTARPYVHIVELKLVDIELPPMVEASIAEKYRQEQLMLEYRYKLEREEKEAERERTEAAGIRDYNLIAAKVSPELLKWRSIDATLELAKSQNSKVVVLGSSQGAQMLFNVDGSLGHGRSRSRHQGTTG
jgi:regulator of protease activity HflC (stomatin/prohibitin superfamily)